MGQLTFPASSRVYFDTAPIIYSVEKHADHWNVLEQFWMTASKNAIEVITSNLTFLETLVKPTRNKDEKLIRAYTNILTSSEIKICEITTAILKDAVKLRAAQKFKTPDAIHAATAFFANCAYIVTNDTAFKRLENINVVIMNDLT